MPCGCDDEKKEIVEKETAKLRFIGGQGKSGIFRGPFLSYETNRVYEVPAELVVTPYWEAVDGKIIEEEEKQVEKEEVAPASPGLKQFSGQPPSERDFLLAMNGEQLKNYFANMGGKVDGRWGRDKLIEEILKLQ